MATINKGKHLYEFGPFRVDPNRRQLWRENRSVPLQPKAFDILLVLVENSEKVVAKDDLLKAVWPETFVEESNLAQNIFVLRKTLGDAVEEKRYIVTVPGRGYRFAEQVRLVIDGEQIEQVGTANGTAQDEQLVVERHSRSRLVVEGRPVPVEEVVGTRSLGLRLAVVLASVVAVVAAAAGYFYFHRAPKLTEKDTIVLGDFDNKTGDPVFDVALRQALSAQLAQSPFLNLLSDSRVANTLSLMGQSKDAHLTAQLTREVCQRTQSTAALDGSIVQIGSRYLLTLKAVACTNGELLASSDAQASDKNHVLDALSRLASTIRPKLGESLASVEKYDVPVPEVTTGSLEALRAYSLARKALFSNRAIEAIPLYKRAISLDPNFAAPYQGLAAVYFNEDETSQAAENMQKAYGLGLIRCALGQIDSAVEWLERAEQARVGILIILGCEPTFVPLRALPRFQSLLKKLGLT